MRVSSGIQEQLSDSEIALHDSMMQGRVPHLEGEDDPKTFL